MTLLFSNIQYFLLKTHIVLYPFLGAIMGYARRSISQPAQLVSVNGPDRLAITNAFEVVGWCNIVVCGFPLCSA